MNIYRLLRHTKAQGKFVGMVSGLKVDCTARAQIKSVLNKPQCSLHTKTAINEYTCTIQ